MKRLLLLIAAVVLLTGLLAGCAGISQEAYNEIKAQLDASKAMIARLQTEMQDKVGELEKRSKWA